MQTVPRLTSRKTKHEDAEFFEEIITILRDEGYRRHWIEMRKKLHGLYNKIEQAHKER